jgi:hypothetical protein
MPLLEYIEPESHLQGIVPIVPHEAFACIFVPNTNSSKWYFAITVEPVYPKQKLGIVVTVDNELKAVKAIEIKKSVERLRDTSTIFGKAFQQSTYVSEFKEGQFAAKLLKLYQAYRKCRNITKYQ